MWSKQKEILKAIRDHREVSVKSGNSVGKSFIASGVVLWWLFSYYPSLVVTTAPTWTQVEEILWKEIKVANSRSGLWPEDKIFNTKIKLKEDWLAIGNSTNKVDNFQGFHSPHLLIVVDEASGVPDIIFQAIDSQTPEKIVLFGNPMRTMGRFWESFDDPKVKKIHISGLDSPNVKNDKILIPGLITSNDIERMKEKYGENSNEYRIRVLGKFPTEGQDVWISIDSIVEAMNRKKQSPEGLEYHMGVDMARKGGDRRVIQIRRGCDFLDKRVFYDVSPERVAAEIIKIAKEFEMKEENIKVDLIGRGGEELIKLLSQQGWNVTEVQFNERAENSARFANLRAECYNKLRDAIKRGHLPDDDDYKEIAQIKYDFTNAGQIIMEKKKKIRQRIGRSPDVADACAMTFAPSLMSGGKVVQGGGVKKYYPEIGL